MSLDRLGDALLALHEEEAQLSPRHFQLPRFAFKRAAIALLVVITLVITAVLGLSWQRHNQSNLPSASILSRLDFAPYLIETNPSFSVDGSTYKYSADQHGLIFNLSGSGLGKLIVSEQASPQEFTTEPAKYASLIESMHKISEIESSPAPIFITRPDGQASGQTAVVNAMGTLVFIQSSNDLSGGLWRQVLATFYQYQMPDPTGY